MRKMLSKLLFTGSLLLAIPLSVFAGWENKTMVFDGENREYRVYTPSGYSTSGSYSLVIGIHGLGDNMTNFGNAFPDFLGIADTANVILVFPQGMTSTLLIGTTTGWNAGAGTMGQYPSEAYDDVGFINALTDKIQADYPIIKEQTYLFGFSNGGFMVQRMACESNDKFAAIASIAGTLGNKITSCNPARQVPILHFHGTADVNVNYSNATGFGLGVDSLLGLWSSNYNCQGEPNITNIPDTKPDGYTVEFYEYVGCGQPLEFFKINDAAHILLNRTDNDISYSDEMWRFFRPKTLGLKNIMDGTSVKLYPVPAEKIITLDLQAVENYTAFEFSVWDYTGKQISMPLNNSANGLYNFDCSKLANGVYFLKAIDGNRVLSKRFTVAN